MKLLSCNVVSSVGAGSKAPADISKILKGKYFLDEININLNQSSNILINKIKKIIYSVKRFFTLLFISNNEYYIMQSNYFYSPFFLVNITAKILKKKKIILFIHDIIGLRSLNKKSLKKELKIFREVKYIIAHNEYMKKFLIKEGIPYTKIYDLACFDYLCNDRIMENKNSDDGRIICYAGNLKKSDFLFELDENKMNYTINLFGKGISRDINSKIKYKGIYNAVDVRNSIYGNLGLVWDGHLKSDDENIGFKNYAKYINPHKLSCYLAADMPVVVWKKSAIADFVTKNNIGYVIDNLYEINTLDFSDINIKKKNAMEIGKRIREGYYTLKVFEKIIDDIKKNDEQFKIKN